jgi:hypothetical protein
MTIVIFRTSVVTAEPFYRPSGMILGRCLEFREGSQDFLVVFLFEKEAPSHSRVIVDE